MYTCVAGDWDANLTSVCIPDVRRDCAAIKCADPGAPDGVYTINPDPACSDSSCYVQAFCDMDFAGGGWTVRYSENF